jgi:hypothetical protein
MFVSFEIEGSMIDDCVVKLMPTEAHDFASLVSPFHIALPKIFSSCSTDGTYS